MSQAAETPTVRIGNVGAIPAVYKAAGIDIDAALRAVGLSADVFDDPDMIVPYKALDELIAFGVRETNCEHLGLLIGMSTPDLGLPSFLLFNAPTVRDGLQDLISALDRFDSGGAASLTRTDDVAELSYAVTMPGLKCVDQIHDHAIALGYALMTRLIGPHFEATEIRLPRRQPSDTAPYRACFQKGRIRFDAHEAVIEFSARYLDAPIVGSDPSLYRLLKRIVLKHGPQIDPSVASQIRRVLPNLIRREPVNPKAVARMFGMNPRTMSRRLAEEQVTLGELVEEARFEVGRQLLLGTDLAMTEIAAALHYSDASAFTRAFRRKFGLAPGAWRAAQR